MEKNNYLIDQYGNPYIENESSPAGGGLDMRCDFNADALYAYQTIGNGFKIEEYLCDKGFDLEEDNFPYKQVWKKGNTRIVLESYIDSLWGYLHTEYVSHAHTLSGIKTLLKEHGYQFNRRWSLKTCYGTIFNSRLGGWDGMEMSISLRTDTGYECRMFRNMTPAELGRMYDAIKEAI